MNCKNCGISNIEDARFCRRCGAKLTGTSRSGWLPGIMRRLPGWIAIASGIAIVYLLISIIWPAQTISQSPLYAQDGVWVMVDKKEWCDIFNLFMSGDKSDVQAYCLFLLLVCLVITGMALYWKRCVKASGSSNPIPALKEDIMKAGKSTAPVISKGSMKMKGTFEDLRKRTEGMKNKLKKS